MRMALEMRSVWYTATNVARADISRRMMNSGQAALKALSLDTKACNGLADLSLLCACLKLVQQQTCLFEEVHSVKHGIRLQKKP